jgi:hypothetical protein
MLKPPPAPSCTRKGMLVGTPQLCCDLPLAGGRDKLAPPLLRGGWEGFKSDMIYGKINNQLCNWYYRINKKLSVVASTNHRVFLWIYVDSFAVGIGSELFIKNV